MDNKTETFTERVRNWANSLENIEKAAETFGLTRVNFSDWMSNPTRGTNRHAEVAMAKYFCVPADCIIRKGEPWRAVKAEVKERIQ